MAYISTPEVKAIREQLKSAFPNLRFGVRREHHTSVTVTIKKGDVDFSDIAGCSHLAINEYYPENYGVHKELVEKITEIIKSAPGTVEGCSEWFDKSDSQSDYFHTAFYFTIQIGAWNKLYEFTG